MLSKTSLRKDFSENWGKNYQVSLFEERGFSRRVCNCGKGFWTLDSERKLCGDASCEDYSFVGKPIAKKKWDYVKTWKEFEKFFKKEGHASIPRYPVVDRWRPDLYFTIASIQDFQRIDLGKIVMEFPSDPLIVPQMCMRFSDLSNVGITGRHHTSFVMSGQHSFGEYWKDRCIELNFRFLNKVMGIPEEKLTYIEDVWAMPDFSQFGPSLETVSGGLELVNSVFSQYTGSGSSYRGLSQKVIDVGWGHERLVWFSQGTPTGYDAVFGPVIEWMKKKTGFKPGELFNKYAVMAGRLDFDEAQDARKIKEGIAKDLGVGLDELRNVVEPVQALYAIADHVKTILFAASDGGIPSNVGGGYNLRVVLRRALSFIKEYELDISIMKIAELHANHLKKMFPELKNGLGLLEKVVEIESEKYESTLGKAKGIIEKELKQGVTEQGLIRLYTSHGISPEVVKRIGGEQVRIPDDFYAKVTAHHLAGRKEVAKNELNADVSELPATRALYYKDQFQKEMDAGVLKVINLDGEKWAVLDSTVFYPEGGGQPGDRGVLVSGGKEVKVTDVQKIGSVVLHKVEAHVSGHVKGRIDWNRRERLMKMHDATHIVAGAVRKVIGEHVWQAGAQKGLETSRLDVTHFRGFSREEVEKIEKEANDAVRKGLKITATEMPRKEAEKKHGFVLYQGGASPGKVVRVVDIHGHDTEACGGTHGTSTRGVGMIKIIRTERIQDGVNRIEFTCGPAAEDFLRDMEELYSAALGLLEESGIKIEKGFVLGDLQGAAGVFSVDVRQLQSTLEKFLKGLDTSRVKGNSLVEAARSLFSEWKVQRKAREKKEEEKDRRLAVELVDKARAGMVFDVISKDRKGLAKVAENMLGINPELTVILANQAGDIVGMSRKEDMGKKIGDICERSGGSGGGRGGVGQGKVKLSKLLKIMGA